MEHFTDSYVPTTAPAADNDARKRWNGFLAFHRANPAFWGLFKQYAQERIDRGFRKYSATTIAHLIRWHTDVPGQKTDEVVTADGEVIKVSINDHVVPIYSRLWMALHGEQHKGFFSIRVPNKANHDWTMQQIAGLIEEEAATPPPEQPALNTLPKEGDEVSFIIQPGSQRAFGTVGKVFWSEDAAKHYARVTDKLTGDSVPRWLSDLKVVS